MIVLVQGAKIKSINNLNKEANEFFAKIGVSDLRKSIEIIPYNAEKDGKIFYQALYHIYGKIIKKPKQEKSIKLIDGLDIRISDKCDLLDKDFPNPTLQITIETRLPWKQRKKTYINKL